MVSTAGWSANPNVLPLWGFDQGFDTFVDVGAFRWASDKSDGRRVLDLVEEALQAVGDDPFFFYVHLMDPHVPYVPDVSDLS